MRDNEFLRRKREREFQQRLLTAIEKPKSHWIWRLINAPIFIWLMTVTLLTLGGAYIGAYQQCIRDGQDEILKFKRLARELYQREYAIRQVIINNNSIEEIRRALPKSYHFYSDFNGHKTVALVSAYHDLLSRIIGYNYGVRIGKHEDYLIGRVLFDGHLPDDLTNGQLAALKKSTESLSYNLIDDDLFFDVLGTLRPACGLANLKDRMINGPEARIVQLFNWKMD